VVVDDRSEDSTADVARTLGANVLRGQPLPEGWAGKVWALHQGVEHSESTYLLFTDADIRHSPESVRRLVSESEALRLGLNSRMARLRCITAAERLLIPAFVWFFGLLYPMRRVNDPNRRTAAAAGGCMLARRDALRDIGGLEAIKSEIIDDVNLAKQIKSKGFPIRLSLSDGDVTSLREYHSLGSIWKMVRRTAFTELRYSWIRLAAALSSLTISFLAPPAWIVINMIEPELFALGVGGALAWILMAMLYRPAVRYYHINTAWSWSLPLVGLLYGGMTLDSAFRGRKPKWR
jgi:hopene-associated glycosyltransferase HpnB